MIRFFQTGIIFFYFVPEEEVKSLIFFYEYRTYTNKYNKKLQSPGALNIKATPGYKKM